MKQVKRSLLMRYGVAVLSVALAVILTLPLGQLATRMPFALFFAAVGLSAWYGGQRPGLLAVALGSITSAYFFLPPVYSLNIGLTGIIQLAVFLTVSLFIILLTSARGRAEESVRENQQWLFTTLNSIGDAVITTDGQGRVIFMNSVAQALTGWKQEEAKGRELKEVFHIVNEGTRQEVESPVINVIRQGMTVGLANNTLLITKDGREVPIDDSGAPIKNEMGEVTGVVLIFRDITERKQAERTRSQLAAIVESSDDVIIGKTLEGIIVSWNAGAERIYGYSASEAIGRPITMLVPPDRADEVPHILEIVKHGEGYRNRETVRRRKDGTLINVSLTVSSVKDSAGNIIGASTIARDITESKRAEQALRASEERYRAFVAQSAEAIWRYELDQPIPVDLPENEQVELFYEYGSLAECNDVMARMYGYGDASEIVGARLSDLLVRSNPENEAFLRAFIRSDYRLNDAESYELDKMGRPKYFLNNLVGIIEDGALLRVWGTQRDITERKQAEAELQQSEQRYRSLADAMPQIVWTARPDGFLDYYNRRWFEYTGMTLEETEGWGWQPVLHPDDVERALRRWATAVKTGESYEIEYRFRRASDGAYRWHLGRGVPMRDREGRIVKWFGTATDIDDQKRAAEALRESEQRFQMLADTAPVMIWMAGTDKLCHYFNKGWLDFTGRTMKEECGEDWAASAHPEDQERRSDIYTKSFDSRQEFKMEYRLRRFDGRYRWVLDTGIPRFTPGGEFAGYIGSCIDITERKEAEEERARLLANEQEARSRAEEANRAKDEFLATLSHELRTPLTAMLGWTRMLRTRDLDETTSAHALETIERNVKAQAQLIEDLLDVSRIITGKLHLDVSPVELMPVIEAALDSVRPAADAKSIHLQTSLDPLTGPVSGDAARLQQVVWNLVSNAVKFTPKGGRVDIRLGRVESHVEISVSDTGQGINQEFLPHVFDRFRQADSSTTRVHGGLGLGLAIVRHLVELHGGTVYAESAGEGKGSTFKVELPIRVISLEKRAGEPLPHGHSLTAPPTLDDLHVLVVDDEQDARDLIVTVLERCGAVVVAVATAAEAFAAMAERRPDILVSDIGMPGEDGYDLIRRVRLLTEEQGGSLPAVALTAYAGRENRQRALEAGFQMHLSKPVDPGELAAAISSLVRPADKV